MKTLFAMLQSSPEFWTVNYSVAGREVQRLRRYLGACRSLTVNSHWILGGPGSNCSRSSHIDRLCGSQGNLISE